MIEELHQLIPAAKEVIPKLFNLTSDSIFRSLELSGIPFTIVRLPAPPTGDWEFDSIDFGDEDILPMLNMKEAGHDGEVIMEIMACSIFDCPPFRCHSSELAKFILDFDKLMFFNGDTIILCPASRTLTVYHHGGVYSHVKL